MIWTIGQFPELKHLEPEQRAAVPRVPWWTYPLVVAGSAIQGLFIGALSLAYLYLIARSWRVASVTSVIAAIAASVAMYLYRLSRIRADMRRTLADAFRGERPPFCFACGYDLRASDARRCPQCGNAISPPH